MREISSLTALSQTHVEIKPPTIDPTSNDGRHLINTTIVHEWPKEGSSRRGVGRIDQEETS